MPAIVSGSVWVVLAIAPLTEGLSPLDTRSLFGNAQ